VRPGGPSRGWSTTSLRGTAPVANAATAVGALVGPGDVDGAAPDAILFLTLFLFPGEVLAVPHAIATFLGDGEGRSEGLLAGIVIRERRHPFLRRASSSPSSGSGRCRRSTRQWCPSSRRRTTPRSSQDYAAPSWRHSKRRTFRRGLEHGGSPPRGERVPPSRQPRRQPGRWASPTMTTLASPTGPAGGAGTPVRAAAT
jgi:hypothetical protein